MQHDSHDTDDSDQESIPDEDIDFQLTYALHTFVATVDGQASVIKGDSLVLLDDSNVYWWLVRVLKTEEVGYIPAENIETPWERLARLNKHRNVELGHATNEELQEAITYENRNQHVRPPPSPSDSRDSPRAERASPSQRTLGSRRKSVVFAAPTYVDHPGVTWSDESDDDDEDGEQEPDEDSDAGLIESELTVTEEDADMDAEETITTRHIASITTPPTQTAHPSYTAHAESTSIEQTPMEPDDGIAWSDTAARESQQRVMEQQAAEGRDSPSGRYGALGIARGPSTGVARPETPREEGKRGEVLRGQDVVNDVHPVEIIDAMRLSPLENQRATPSLRSVSTTSQVSSSSYASTARSDSASPDLDGRKKKDGSAKKKRSGVFSGLFKKRDKTKPAAVEDKARASDESFVNRSQVAPGPTGSPLVQRSGPVPPRASHSQQLDHSHPRYQDQAALSGVDESANRALESTASSRLGVSDAGSFTTGRPGSIIAPPNLPAFGELTVLRVFAGDTVESENTFKTVLMNEETDAKRLVQQAVQRLQLPPDDEYYLVIKEADGEQVELAAGEKVLEKFFAMNSQYDDDHQTVTRVRRSSIGSISSIASNLSQHPAIRKFAANDYSDDSSVKLFLHRRPRLPPADTSSESVPTTPTRAKPFPYLSVATDTDGSPASSTGSPTARFSVQIVIASADLPESMAIETETEVARVLLKRGSSEAGMTSRKLLLLPRNATVAEVIEAGLEKFGISGVVAGGDDVEDKISKRRSMMRARYGLVARAGDEEVALQPNSRVLDAYREPPVFKYNQMSKEMRRRSREFPGAAQEDIQPTDPVFVLRRVIANPPGSPKVALDEVEVKRRRSADSSPHVTPTKTTQQIIAEQRAASRAKQHALLSAQENTENGLDVHLPDKGTVRSSRITIDGEEHVRYSYISNEGDTIDISQVVQAELDSATDDAQETLLSPVIPEFSRQGTDQSIYRTAPSTPLPDDESIRSHSTMPPAKPDLLQRAISHTGPDNATDIANKLDRIIDMAMTFQAEDHDRSTTPVPLDRKAASAEGTPRAVSPSESEISDALGRDASLSPIIGKAPPAIKQAMEPYRSTVTTPRASATRYVPRARHQRQQPSIASILSDVSVQRESSAAPTLGTIPAESDEPFGMSEATEALRHPLAKPSRPILLDDDFGFTTMISIIQARADSMRPNTSALRPPPVQNEVERRYLGGSSTAKAPEAVQKRYAAFEQRLLDEEKEISALMERVLAFAVETGRQTTSV
ncbi:hypothetical protein NliqN6_2997 [Naganishia liquefaciens]|uniref:SH3 domain-containing protein n=1 Tax=Naganishia liquefaciens TaxID=104408 RepID=A0A8H3TTX4_9TREE|nr:hypothetical protein NliqN6_2997 [Naganishia liquefaciens]